MLVREGVTAAARAGVVGAGRLRLAVVMPAFNEEGLPEFLAELEAHLQPLAAQLAFVIVDDTSVTPVSELLRSTTPALRSSVTVVRNEVNLGHGPSALRAYRCGLATGADLVLHVDGDGQFLGADVAALVVELWTSTDAGAVGVRTDRSDPWFRKVLTRSARVLVSGGDVPVRDANTPLRAYRREAIAGLLDLVEPMATVPHLQFTVLERRSGLAMRERAVTHRVRRGDSAVGTTWQGRGSLLRLPSRRLVGFSLRAAAEVFACVRGSERCSAVVPPFAAHEAAA